MPLNAFHEIHEKLICVIEDLVEDYTGEAKHGISELQSFVKRLDTIPSAVGGEIVAALQEPEQRLNHDSYDLTARRQLVRLRLRIRNTISELSGEPKLYSWGEPFEL